MTIKNWVHGCSHIKNPKLKMALDALDAFDEFMFECDVEVTRMIGLGVDDMPDAPWHDFFDDGMSPEDAVQTAIEDHWDMELMTLDGVW